METANDWMVFRGALHRDGEAWLEHTLGPDFVANALGKEVRHRPCADPAGFEPWLTEADLWDFVERVPQRVLSRELRLVRADLPDPIDNREYTSDGDLANPKRVRELVEDGATLVLQGVEARHPEVARRCRALLLHLGRYVQANLYLSPAGVQGLRTHHDLHDVLVVQQEGSKCFVLHRAQMPDPVQGQLWPSGLEPPPAAHLSDTTLRRGDALYFPRGTLHRAVACEGRSLHLTLGLFNTSWWDLLLRLPERLKHLSALRRDIPVQATRRPASLVDAGGPVIATLCSWLQDDGAVALASLAVEDFVRAHGAGAAELSDYWRTLLVQRPNASLLLRLRPTAFALVRTGIGGPRLLCGKVDLALSELEFELLRVLQHGQPVPLGAMPHGELSTTHAAIRNLAANEIIDPMLAG